MINGDTILPNVRSWFYVSRIDREGTSVKLTLHPGQTISHDEPCATEDVGHRPALRSPTRSGAHFERRCSTTAWTATGDSRARPGASRHYQLHRRRTADLVRSELRAAGLHR